MVLREPPLKSSDFQLTLGGEKLSQDWDFAKADTSYLTHGLHDYPARMIPQIARRLIEDYSQKGDFLLDPFCGSGTTLVEARLTGRNALGSDINPFAILLSKVKSTPIDIERSKFDTEKFLKRVESDYLDKKKAEELPAPPADMYPNLLHWFKEDVSRDLEFLYEYVKNVKDADIQDLLKVVLSDTVFKSSNIDHRSSRFIRILPPDKLRSFRPDVFGHFRKKLIDSISRIDSFTKQCHANLSVKAGFGDARELEQESDSVDAIITSPPYGEEKNTVGYARWSKFSIAWLRLNHEKLGKSEKLSLGFRPAQDVTTAVQELPSPTAKRLLSDLVKKDKERVRDALPFFFEYLSTLQQMYRVSKSGAFCCIVIGDRSIRMRPLNMDKVTVELGKEAGFAHVKSFHRAIPMKLIPWTTPTGRTISRESMVILKKG